MIFFLIIIISVISLTTQSKLKTSSMSRQLANNNNQTVIIRNETVPITPRHNVTSEHIPDTEAPIPLPGTVHPESAVISANNRARSAPANLTGTLIGYAMPIPLPPSVHPNFMAGGRSRFINNNTLINNTAENNRTMDANNRTPTDVSPSIGAGFSIPLIPASFAMLSGKYQNIPVNFWVVAGNKTYIALRNENENYVKCERGAVLGASRNGNLSEIATNFLWEPEFVNNTNINFRTYDGYYLDYRNYKFNCLSTSSPTESYIINKHSYLTGGATENRTDYITFQRGIFYLGLVNDEVKLVEADSSFSKFVPIFNRTLPNNPLPSS